MDRLTTLHHLSMAERHVALGETHLASQRRVIAELERDGHASERARQLPDIFEKTQALHVADRDRLRKELARWNR